MAVRGNRAGFSRWTGALFAAATLALLATGCSLRDFPQSSLHPHSDYAWTIQHLLEQLTFWVVVIFALVQALLIYTVIRFRSRPGAPDPKPVHGNTVLEIAWTVAPAIILTVIAVPTVMAIFQTQGKPPKDAIHVKVVGHQWWWEFQYPELGVVTGSEMHVPVNKPVAVDIETVDVLHSFWFPAVGGKRDAVPNHTNRMFFTPDSVGEFPGQCAELCGISHANMRMKLFVDTPEAFAAWVADQKKPPAEPDSSTLAGRGKLEFSNGACVSCHTIDGISAGTIGPNLTHFGSRTSIAGAIYDNNTENLAHWIATPDKRKPGTLMLNLGLEKSQVDALVAYMQSLK